MRYAVVAWYAHGDLEIWDIISVHSTHELAERAARGDNQVGIVEVDDSVHKGDNAHALRYGYAIVVHNPISVGGRYEI